VQMPRRLLLRRWLSQQRPRQKKAEKALFDADQKRVQQERAIAERLDKISVLIGSKCRVVLFWLLAQICIADILFAFFGLFLCGAAEKIGVSWKLRQPDTEDPLLAGWICWNRTGN
jgi:hypothetical protein